MNGKSLAALSALGIASVVALTLSLLPVSPAVSVASQPALGTPFKQVQVYQTPGGLLRTETLRWQGPGSVTIVTWSANNAINTNPKSNDPVPPWVAVELQNMQTQQLVMATAMQPMLRGMNQTFRTGALLGIVPPLTTPVRWPKVEQPEPAAPHSFLPHHSRMVNL